MEFFSADFLKMCPEGPGRMDTGNDLNECELMPNVCDGGECVNTDGSFRCVCPSGFVLDSTGKKCVDDNECVSTPNVCGNGTCTNVIGGFECSCNDGWASGPLQVSNLCRSVISKNFELITRKHFIKVICANLINFFKHYVR